MFLDRDEYIIVMDMNLRQRDIGMSAAQLGMLADAGVRTVYFHAAIRWDKMQPRPEDEIDWSWPDRCVERARAAGLKSLIPCLFTIPQWKPDHYFYSRQDNGQLYDVPNYSDDETGADLDEFIGRIIDRYAGEDVQVVYSIPGNGEFACNGFPRMDYPMEVFTGWVVDRQRPLAAQHGEIWTAYHPIQAPPYFKPIYGALFSAYPFEKHYGIIFTYVQHSLPHFHEWIRENQEAGMIYFGGSEYVQGLKQNLEKLMAGKMRMFTAPTHPYQGHEEIRPWMQREIQEAIGRYGRRKSKSN
jgi:hypothetical protein